LLKVKLLAYSAVSDDEPLVELATEPLRCR